MMMICMCACMCLLVFAGCWLLVRTSCSTWCARAPPLRRRYEYISSPATGSRHQSINTSSQIANTAPSSTCSAAILREFSMFAHKLTHIAVAALLLVSASAQDKPADQAQPAAAAGDKRSFARDCANSYSTVMAYILGWAEEILVR